MIKLFSLNIERMKHYDRWIPYIQKSDFDVICLQEVCESDIELIENRLGLQLVFVPMCNILRDDNGEEDVCGIAISSYIPMLQDDAEYYFSKYNVDKKPDNPVGFKFAARALITATFEKDNTIFNINTTHFTVTPPGGEITEQQRKDAIALLNILGRQDSFVLCGDMNAPRGKECFGMFSEKYIDHIPQHYKRSLDMEMRSSPFVGDPDLMVDCLFSTEHYRTNNVELVPGLSDHMGIVADIYKKEE